MTGTAVRVWLWPILCLPAARALPLPLSLVDGLQCDPHERRFSESRKMWNGRMWPRNLGAGRPDFSTLARTRVRGFRRTLITHPGAVLKFGSPCIALTYCLGIFWSTYRLHQATRTPTPWKGSLAAAALLLAAMAVSSVLG